MSTLTPDSPVATQVVPSPNHSERRASVIDMLILHYTGMADGTAALHRLRDPLSEVSTHYLVMEDGRVIQMVPEARRAWHAGRGAWKGVADVNSRSIGIEIANGGHAAGLPAYPDGQMTQVTALCRDILGRHGIAADYVLGHSDVAPDRKEDPGEHFPWSTLAAAGVGHWVPASPIRDGRFLSPGESGQPIEALQAMLALYGYAVPVNGSYDEATRLAVIAFQRHFRPTRVDGIADASTITTLRDLLAARS